MKLLLYCFSMMLIFYSCNNDDIGNVHCFNNFGDAVFSNADSSIGLEIPTIIINDASDYGVYAIKIFDTNSGNILPETIKFEVFDVDENLIFINNEVSATESSYKITYLWNGVIDNIPYNGVVSFKLFVQVNSELSGEITGTVEVLSCDKLKECMMEIPDCNVADCRFYGDMIERNEYVSNSCF